MTKCNSLRSLKKRRRSVDKRSSVRKERRKYKFSEEHQHTPPEEEAAARAIVRDELDKEQSKEWLPWWKSSTLINFYSWCQSSVTEGIEVFKDAVFPTRSLRRELNEVTRQLQLMEEKMERMSHNLPHASLMDNGSTLHTAPPPVAPPPPPIAPPAPPVSFKGHVTAKKNIKPVVGAAAKKDSEQQKQLVVTLSDIQNVQLKNVTTTTNKTKAMKSPEGLLRAGLKRCHHMQRENQFHCSPKLLVTTRKKLKTTGLDRTPGGTPITTASHDAQI